MSGRHLKVRVFILHYLRPLRQAEVGAWLCGVRSQ